MFEYIFVIRNFSPPILSFHFFSCCADGYLNNKNILSTKVERPTTTTGEGENKKKVDANYC